MIIKFNSLFEFELLAIPPHGRVLVQQNLYPIRGLRIQWKTISPSEPAAQYFALADGLELNKNNYIYGQAGSVV